MKIRISPKDKFILISKYKLKKKDKGKSCIRKTRNLKVVIYGKELFDKFMHTEVDEETFNKIPNDLEFVDSEESKISIQNNNDTSLVEFKNLEEFYDYIRKCF